MKSPAARWMSAAAFSLVEVALALGVASFCLVAVVALVPLGIDTSQMGSDQATASSILTHVLADLRATPMTSPPGAKATSAQYSVVIPAHTVADTPTQPKILYFGNTSQQFSPSLVQGTSRYRLTINFLPPDSDRTAPAVPLRTATAVTLLVSWPPNVDPNDPKTGTPTGRVQVFAGLDRN